jgi:hypothetical protein
MYNRLVSSVLYQAVCFVLSLIAIFTTERLYSKFLNLVIIMWIGKNIRKFIYSIEESLDKAPFMS